MTRHDFNQYLDRLRRRWPQGFFLARSFRTTEEWNRWSSIEFRVRASGGEGEPRLENVLYHRRTVILGEAGSGKSAVARRTIDLGAENGFIPIFVQLTSYAGDLAALVREEASEEVLKAADVDDAPAAQLYIFDGLDEVAAEHVDDFFRQFNDLARDEPNSRVLLTSRQAFFVARQQRLEQPLDLFHLLDFSDRDVDVVIQHAGVDPPHFATQPEGPISTRNSATRSRSTRSSGCSATVAPWARLVQTHFNMWSTRPWRVDQPKILADRSVR